MTLLQDLRRTAEEHLDLGRSLLPTGQNKRPHTEALIQTGFSETGEEGDLKAAWRVLQEMRPTLAHLTEWLRFPGIGLGLVTGGVSGVIALDGDGEAGRTLFRAWDVDPHAVSRSGGPHWYVRHPGWRVATVQSTNNKRLAQVRGVDVRADGGYIVLPPSVVGGRAYRALRPHADLDDAAALPPAVRALFGLDAPPAPPPAPRPAPGTAASPGAFGSVTVSSRAGRWVGRDGTPLETELLARALASAFDGQGRDNSCFDLACQLRANLYAEGEAWEVLCAYVDQVPDTNTKGEREPYTLGEARHVLKQAYSRPPREPWKAPRAPRPPAPTVLDDLRSTWHALSPDVREEAAFCLLGARGSGEAEEALLRELGHDPAAARVRVEAARAARRIVPGLTRLRRLLQGAPLP